MSAYIKFNRSFYKEVEDLLSSKKISGFKSRKEKGLDLRQMFRKASDIQVVTFYKYCDVAKVCPVKKWIYHNRHLLTREQLLSYADEIFPVNNGKPN